MHILRAILDFFLPTRCSYCQSPVGGSRVPFFCSACWADFSVMSGALCPRCGKSFESPEALTYSPDHECLSCRQTPPLFDQALSIGYFEGPLREAIHQFKYRPCRSLGRPLAEWMSWSIVRRENFDVIVPVPLHTDRLRYRGFNQSLLLAAELGRIFRIPLSYDNLVRTRYTRPQVELTGEERIRNVSGAFSLKSPQALLDRTILLVDDVFTTGATINECARVLKTAGAARVIALTVARAT